MLVRPDLGLQQNAHSSFHHTHQGCVALTIKLGNLSTTVSTSIFLQKVEQWNSFVVSLEA